MALDRERARQSLKAFDFRRLFIEQLGWDKYTSDLDKTVDGRTHHFIAVSEKRGVVVLVCDSIPDYTTRVKLDRLIAKDHFEHLIIFVDRSRGRQAWQWMRRESGKPNAIRAYTYSIGQTGELLLQRLEYLVVTLEEEEQTGLADVLGRMRAGFDVEKVTKKFYERFKAEHERFLKFVDGIPDNQMEAWYASVMINRLMFLYFIQAKNFLNGDPDYLRNKLKESSDRKKDGYYRDFLCPLFFEGFARKKEERSAAVNKLLGNVPYLNGGLFQRHQIEELYGKKIQIADIAFEHLFSFFKEYNWHLDERENRDDREINPDVLGYIFEKYINQKQMGAYYTKEDITEYICKNTIIPFLLDAARKDCAVAFDKNAGVWRLLRDDPDRYIYPEVLHGAELPLPSEIAAGLACIEERTTWNRPGSDAYSLPTEIWREVIDRRRRCTEVRERLGSGEVQEVNDLITLNLDIRQFAQDVIQYCEGPELLRALYKAISRVSVLDPTCGSGAFLFAALNILKSLYEACFQRMQMFVDELDAGPAHHPKKFEDFRQILQESKQHPKQDYFILKSIIVNNLYGVDIMEEAVEICKLRLFLKLVAQVDSQDRIEPLPDIDFNIRAGNTLVGYTRLSDIRSGQANLYLEEQLRVIEDKAKKLDSAMEMFRLQQTVLNGTVTIEDKLSLRQRFGELGEDLNDFLSVEYGVKKPDTNAWKQSYKPFHWFSDFHRIMQSGGFDVVVGNPPYLEKSKLDQPVPLGFWMTASCPDIYSWVVERALTVRSLSGRLGLIVPISIAAAEAFAPLRQELRSKDLKLWTCHFANRPGQLFTGAQNRLTIILAANGLGKIEIFSTRYHRWDAKNGERNALFPKLAYASVHELLQLAHGSVPKIGSATGASMFRKLGLHRPLAEILVRHSEFVVYWVRVPGYFCQFYIHPPMARPERGGPARPRGELLNVSLSSADYQRIAHAMLNSSTFYTYFCFTTDGRHVNPSDVKLFPSGIDRLDRGRTANLRQASIDLEEGFRRNISQVRKSGLLIDSVDMSQAKSSIDSIDRILAAHYGFTDEELDFILNYDIKFRMGADADEG
jgi:hypothetical protein